LQYPQRIDFLSNAHFADIAAELGEPCSILSGSTSSATSGKITLMSPQKPLQYPQRIDFLSNFQFPQALLHPPALQYPQRIDFLSNQNTAIRLLRGDSLAVSSADRLPQQPRIPRYGCCAATVLQYPQRIDFLSNIRAIPLWTIELRFLAVSSADRLPQQRLGSGFFAG